jgi:hypothetical protein
MMKVLVGCEESQAVTIAFREAGHEAYSCDLKPCSGGHPEWHFQMDVFKAIRLIKPNLAIYHPPCTFLTVSANKWFKDQPPRKSGALVGEERRKAREDSLKFVRDLMNSNVEMICIENPVGVIGSRIFKYIGGENGAERWEVFPGKLEHGGRKPDQTIQPWMFGHGETKATCLWLKGLPKLKPTNIVSGRVQKLHSLPPSDNRAELRSKTYEGIAKAMAEQWGVAKEKNAMQLF